MLKSLRNKFLVPEYLSDAEFNKAKEKVKDYKIKDYFSDGLFKCVVRQLEKEGVLTIGDYLDKFNAVTLGDLKSIGEFKRAKFDEQLCKILEEAGLSPENMHFRINAVHRNTPVSALNRLLSNALEQKGIVYLTDVNNFHKSEIIDALASVWSLGNTYRRITVTSFVCLEKEFNEYANIIFNEYKETRSNYGIVKKRIQGVSLVALAQELDMTFENVRRKQLRMFDELSLLFTSLLTYYRDKGVIAKGKRITEDDLLSNLDNKEVVEFFMFFIKQDLIPNLRYSRDMNLFFYEMASNEVESLILETFKNYNTVMELTQDNRRIIEDLNYLGLDFLALDDVKALLLANGYKSYKNFINKGALRYEDMVAYIIRLLYKEGIDLQKDYELVIKLVDDFFGVTNLAGHKLHNFKSYTGRGSSVIINSRNTVTHIANVCVPMDMLELIRLKLIEVTKGSEKVRTRLVFESLKEEIPCFEDYVSNQYLLYGLVKYHFDKEFNFKRFTVSKK